MLACIYYVLLNAVQLYGARILCNRGVCTRNAKFLLGYGAENIFGGVRFDNMLPGMLMYNMYTGTRRKS